MPASRPQPSALLPQLRLLGGCALAVGGQAVDLRYDKVRALLALLAMGGGETISRALLADRLWPDLDAEAARRNLRHAVHVLRTALGPHVTALQADRQGLRLDPGRLACDALALVAAHERWCRGGDAERYAAALAQAAQIYAGEFLAGVAPAGDAGWDDWLRDQRMAAASRAADLWRELARLRLAAAMPREALGAARRLLDLDPGDDTANQLCMQALAQTEGAQAALAHYAAWCARLHGEGAQPPSAQAEALARSLQGQPVAGPQPPERRPVAVLCVQQVAAPDETVSGQDDAHAFAAMVEVLRQRAEAGTVRLALPHEGLALAYFGLPMGREDAALAAAHLAAQLALRPGLGSTLAIALHCGLATLDSAALQPPGLGPLANAALRLAAQTQPGSIAVSDEAARWLRRDIARRGEPLRLDAHPQQAGAFLLGARPGMRAAQRAGMDVPLVGRRAELARLLAALRGAGSARTAMAVVGEAGLGKTRLALQAAQAARRRGPVVWLRCSRESRAEPLAPLRAWVAGMAALRAGEDAALSAAKVARLERRLHSGGALAALYGPLAQGAKVSPRERAGKLVEWARRLGPGRTLTVVVDDVQWADPTTQELLALWLHAAQVRVFTLLLAREAADVPEGVQVLAPARLEEKQARALLQQVQPAHTLAQPEVEAALRLAEGLPICLVEAKRHWSTGQDAQRHALPRSLHELLGARLENLSAALRRLAGSAAVLGHEGAVEVLAQLVELPVEQLQSQLARLAEDGLMQAAEHGRWRFRHQMLQHAAVERLPLAERARLHALAAQRLAGVLPPARLAHHWEEAGEPGRAVDAHAAAGQQALAEGAQREAMHHFSRVLALGPQHGAAPQAMFSAWYGKGLAQAVLEGYASPEAHQCFLRAREIAQAREDTLGVLRATWGIWLSSSDRVGFRRALDEARYLLACAQQLPPGFESDLWHCLAHSAVGNNLLWLGRLAQAQGHLQTTVELADRPGIRARIAAEMGEAVDLYSLGFLAWIARKMGDARQATALLQRAWQRADALGNPPSRALAWGMGIVEAMMSGDTAAGAARAQKTREAALAVGYDLWTGIAAIAQTWVRAAQGHEAELQSLGATIEGAARAMPSAVLRFMVPYLRTLCERGRHAQGLAVAQQALAISRQVRDRFDADTIWRLRAQCLAATGRPQEAAQAQRRADRLHGALQRGLRGM